ncbi:Na+/H+ antiporter [Nitzschia inconspicua]|uniref:Na+/H+ antiporter n=1 Tax=Nitzschia inconspicua TaxID=303405 RepID=A0A9K3LKK5_9STRA|nr:Na+/H+ antiporter [Nitzschia inconspicua]
MNRFNGYGWTRQNPRLSFLVSPVLGVSILLLAIITFFVDQHDATTKSSVDTHINDTSILLKHRHLDEIVVLEIETSHEMEQLSVNVTFEEIIKTIVFLMCTWLSANFCKMIGLPSFVGEIIAGVVLGPPVLDFCPYPEAMVLVGSFGLIGLVLNSGIDLDIAQLRETGTRAVLIAASGTALALSTGIAVSYLVDIGSIQSAFSIGAAFAPSSWGVASQVLSKGGVLNTPAGQTIMASSVVDDILGLVLLSLLEVFVMENPGTVDYIKPFVASFGYLIVLGLLGITVIPKVLQQFVLPRVAEEKQDGVAIGMMFILMAIYLPVMNYSGASYLTGAFLAGISFSQLHHVHATFAKSSHEVMVWLMRIFFAATIGFQVPAIYFKEPLVLRKGCIFLIPVFSKFFLGFLIPRFHRNTADDFPYNPYWRDFWITSFSMICRGEFNFVVAAVALRAGLLSPTQYAGIVFSVLISCVVSPLVLARIIHYYNKKSLEYLEKSHPIQRIGNTCDGYRPLYLAIQARTPVHWGLHDKLEQTLEEAGLIIIDHRSWHTIGYRDAVNITEIFCQDKQLQVRIPGCFSKDTQSQPSVRRSGWVNDCSKEKTARTLEENVSEGETSSIIPPGDVAALIEERKVEIREVIAQSIGAKLDSNECAVQVSEWEAFSFPNNDPERGEDGKTDERFGYCFHSSVPSLALGTSADEKEGNGCDANNAPPTRIRTASAVLSRKSLSRAVSNASGIESIATEDPHLGALDLWDTDFECHYIAREGYYQTPVAKDGSTAVTIEEGCPLEHALRHRAESANRSMVDSTAGSRGDSVSHRQSEALEEPPAVANVRRRNMHQRNHTLDVSMLDSYDLETFTIKERLHGYVRP